MENIEVRKAKREDSKMIWEIRNQPLARQNSNSRKELPFKEHDQWFENKYFKAGENFCFVLCSRGKVAGYCRFDFNVSEDDYVASIAIGAEHQGKGFGAALLNQAINLAEIRKDIIAQTLKKNISSQKIFEKNNFEIYGEDDSSYYFKLKK